MGKFCLKQNILILLIVFQFISPSFSAQETGSDWGINYGLSFKRMSIYRGAKYWDEASYFPALLIRYKKIRLRGPSVLYTSDGPRKPHFEIGVRYFDDSKPSFASGDEGVKNSRSSTIDGFASKLWMFGPLRLRLGLVKNLDRHHGDIQNIRLGYQIHPLVGINLGANYGDLVSNQYAYGQSAKSGIGSAHAGISVFIPFFPWGGIARFNFSYHEIIQEENQKAELVLSDHQNVNANIMFLWSL